MSAQSRLAADLGFDSLLVAELTVALEKAGMKPPPEAEVAGIATAGELARALVKREDEEARAAAGPRGARGEGRRDPGPAPVAAAGQAAIAFFQKALYGGVFDIEVKGQANVPSHAPFLVAANHTSHLDVGLVKIALGDGGQEARLAGGARLLLRQPLEARLVRQLHQPRSHPSGAGP